MPSVVKFFLTTEKDKATIEDFRDLFIYLHGFCNMEKKANLNNTIITMITPKLAVRLLQKIQRDLVQIKGGIWKFNVNTFYIYFVEINEFKNII
ncbi:MAG: hypothetical protein KatS3mg129_1433 [Leptospiraceae bacterium]|nr:MAG: hypothetical protein KatS3mg129_1433 [Leptospiraceae bacterium]